MLLVEDEFCDACRTRLCRINSAISSNNTDVIGLPAHVYREIHRTSVFSSAFKRIWTISVAWPPLLSCVSFADNQDEIAQPLGPFEKATTATSGVERVKGIQPLVVDCSDPSGNRKLHGRFLAPAAFRSKSRSCSSEPPNFASISQAQSPGHIEPASCSVAC